MEAYDLSQISRDPARGFAWTLHQDASMLMDWVLPRWWGQIFDGVVDGPFSFYDGNYIGQPALVGLAFALVALVRRKLNLRVALPWLAVGVFAWLMTYDDGLGMLLRRLPVFERSVNIRWVFSVGFAALVLAAFGWDWFVRWATGGRRVPSVLRATALTLLVLGVGVMAAHLAGLFPQPDMGFGPSRPLVNATPSYRIYWGVWAMGAALALAGAVMLWWMSRPGRRTTAVMALIVAALLTSDLWMLLFTFNQGSPREWYYPTTDFITQERALVSPTERVLMQGQVWLTNTALVYGVRDWRYQDPMISRRAYRAAMLLSPGYHENLWTQYNMIFPHIRPEIAPVFGIRYLIYPAESNPDYVEPEPGQPHFKRLAFTEGLGLWEIEGVPGFAYLSDDVQVAPDEAAARDWVDGMTWEKVRTYPAMVEAPESAVAGIAPAPGGTSPGSSTVLSYTPGSITVETEAQRPALLVVAETYYPGWHATVDGQPAAILRANYLSQGVVVPEGKHTVELRYEPDSLRTGAVLSAASLAGLAGLVLWWRRGHREERLPAPASDNQG
jgi:hypothetical protein